MPHVKHPVSNPAHGCAQPLHLIGFGLCSKPELKTEQEVRFLNKLLELRIAHECAILIPSSKWRPIQLTAVYSIVSLCSAHGCAPKLHLIGFVLCSKPELKTAQDVQFFNNCELNAVCMRVPRSTSRNSTLKRAALFEPWASTVLLFFIIPQVKGF